VLALTDQGLAHLLIAAGRVRRERRGRWLRDVAAQVETERKRTAAVRRTRACRQRQRDGVRRYTLEIDDTAMETVLDALVSYGRLSEPDTLRRDRVQHALAELVVDFGRRWRGG